MLALCLVGVVSPLRSLLILVTQIAGAIVAADLVEALIPGDNVLFAVQLRAGTSVEHGFFMEMFFTAGMVFTILMLVVEVRSIHDIRGAS